MMKAIVLDFNGVIVDDERVHYSLMRDLVSPFGLAMSEQDYFDKYVVYRDEEAFQLALKEVGREPSPDLVDRLVKEKRRRYLSEALGDIQVFPGVREFIITAAASCLLAIASAAAREEIEGLLGHLGLKRYIAAVVAAEDVERGKPAPDVYIEALDRLASKSTGLHPSDAVAIEDTPGGIAAARKAGLRVAAVPNTFPPEELGEADIILSAGLASSSLDQLRRLFDSPQA